MSEIPPEAQCYFEGVKANDASAVATCFTEDGLVIDVGGRIEGRAAIQSWTENEVLGGVYEIVSDPAAGRRTDPVALYAQGQQRFPRALLIRFCPRKDQIN